MHAHNYSDFLVAEYQPLTRYDRPPPYQPIGGSPGQDSIETVRSLVRACTVNTTVEYLMTL